jgi:hypothetical protein
VKTSNPVAAHGLLAALLLGSSCAPLPPHAPKSPAVVERLYFGRNAGNNLAVTDTAWTEFLSDFVTPRFPDGLTSWQAEGQWRSSGGVLQRESSFVLELVHPARPQIDQAITEIIAEYKRRFHQESVLRVQTNARASY